MEYLKSDRFKSSPRYQSYQLDVIPFYSLFLQIIPKLAIIKYVIVMCFYLINSLTIFSICKIKFPFFGELFFIKIKTKPAYQ